MVKVGQAPYLECSSRGDRRFSAYYAKPSSLGGRTIEQAYQAMKIFVDGSRGLSVDRAKGRFPVNYAQCRQKYFDWWVEYVRENGLIGELKAVSGLSDMFGQAGHVCQAEVLWKIRNSWEYINY